MYASMYTDHPLHHIASFLMFIWFVFSSVFRIKMTVIESRDRNKSNSGSDFGKSKIEVYVHNQVLRIREEDSHLGEDIGASLSAKAMISASDNHRRDRDPEICSSHMDFVVFSRPILPPSPLGGKMKAANTVR